MKSILMSIHPKRCERIFNGEKTIEVRKTAPKPPFKVVVYCTKRKFSHRKPYLYVNEKKAGEYNSKNKFSAWSECRETLCINAGSYCEFEAFLTHGKVIGEFVCDSISNFDLDGLEFFQMKDHLLRLSNLTEVELKSYIGKGIGKALHITNLKVYDKPKELGEFRKPCGDCIGKCTGEHYDRCPWRTITRPPQSYMRIEDLKED